MSDAVPIEGDKAYFVGGLLYPLTTTDENALRIFEQSGFPLVRWDATTKQWVREASK